MKLRSIVSVLVVWACATLLSGCSDNTSALPKSPRFAVYIAMEEKSERRSVLRFTPDGQEVYTSVEPLLTEHDVAGQHFGDFADGFPILTLDLTSDGIRRLTDRPAEYVSKRFLIVWDDQPVAAPKIISPLSGQIAIVSSEWLPATQLQAISEYLSQMDSATVNSG